jgi:starvation-inducible outer membrane lipoprotein
MKRNLCIGTLILAAAFALSGCATMQGLPQGAVLVAEYQGPFTGKFFWGTTGLKVYEAPGGSRPVIGWFEQEADPGSMIVFRGDLQDLRFQGQFTIVDGTISGDLSADGKSLSGTYTFSDFPFDHGTWQAQKK